MCGINGFNWNDRKVVKSMNHLIRHRGPDDEGFFVDNDVSLGHRRLSIIDLSKKGHQPMYNNSRSIVIVYNGEIYNYAELKNELIHLGYKFRSNTDTEVVLAAYEEWGVGCLDKFNGMWAFCIYDKKKNHLFLSRDRFGIKPLYYYHKDGKFIFSSEIKPILRHDVSIKPNTRLISDFLLYNITDHTDSTFFTSINKIPKGAYALYDLSSNSFSIYRYWKNISREIKTSKVSSVKKIKELLVDSVNLRLISDTSVGTLLSGGLDSSTITALIKHRKKVGMDTYSAVFSGFRNDETVYIDEVVKYTQTNNMKISPTVDDLYNELSEYVNIMEEPIPGTSPYSAYCVHRLAKQNGTTVLLNGQGSDEILGGYTYLYGFYLKGLLLSGRFIRFFIELVYMLLGNHPKTGFLSFIFVCMPGFVRKKYFMIKSNVKRHMINKYGTDYLERYYSCPNLKSALIFHLNKKLEHLLKWEDKNSMANSREARVPFLDYRVVQYILSLPDDYLIRNGQTKWILRQAIDGLLPLSIINRNKIGFFTPEDMWIRSSKINHLLNDLFIDKEPLCSKYVNVKKLRKMITLHLNNKKNYGRILWKSVFLEVWLNHFFKESK